MGQCVNATAPNDSRRLLAPQATYGVHCRRNRPLAIMGPATTSKPLACLAHGASIMRFAQLAALVALTCFSVQPAFAQTLLTQVEQGLQAPGGGQSGGTQPSGYLGAELDDEGQMGKGVLVTRIRPGTPAENSGLKAGDLITQVDGKPVQNLDAYDAVAKRPPNTSMTMTIEREGRSQ